MVIYLSRIRWSKEETALLKKIYKYKTANELKEYFPQYNNTQILRKAKQLGLKKDELVVKKSRLENSIIQRQDLWEDAELKILYEFYPQEGALGVQKRLPKHRELSAIVHQANRRHLTREQKDLIWKIDDYEINNDGKFTIKIKYKGY